jgi:GxxExxY protein
MVERDPLTEKIIGAAVEVHRHLGPGLLESVYHRALSHELELQKIPHACGDSLPVEYKGIVLGDNLRHDVLVKGKVIVEQKAVENWCRSMKRS